MTVLVVRPELAEIKIIASERDIDADTALSLETSARLRSPSIPRLALSREPSSLTCLVSSVCPPTCFHHCLVACRDLRSWVAEHDSHGLGLSRELQRRDEAEVKACATFTPLSYKWHLANAL